MLLLIPSLSLAWVSRSSSSTVGIIMPKRKHKNSLLNNSAKKTTSSIMFQETTATEASCLTDGVKLASFGKDTKVILPWMGYGTYRLGKQQALPAVLQALEVGYRAIDTAFIYGGETTERLVGQAIQKALKKGVIQSRQEVFVTTKHWRKYHGYEPTLKCLKLSLKRLQLDQIDLWLMHWPGPAWTTMNRKKELVQADPWHYAATDAAEIAAERAETWRAMEDAVRQGLCRAIGVSNMTVDHLKTLKKTAIMWPPAVNQVEFHPLYPQTEVLEYCQKEGIVLQAYASLGGQDTGKSAWAKLLGKPASSPSQTPKKEPPTLDLMHSEPVVRMAAQLTDGSDNDDVTPAQVLLRWGLERGAALIPKTTSKDRLLENARVFDMHMSQQQVDGLQEELIATVQENNPDQNVGELTRLCWRSDPLRHLNFE